ncbi:hypothetical protein DSO57_1035097 [Entomophthora muscae]|uniref:Uncharacterized protein n=1 Tax=Entomophthora muscae TaxID=34485 RepID=A0ACC2RQI8_9FUNG|nr:hypothetical protein DSO57_1035097 [Entomophthora muscae]
MDLDPAKNSPGSQMQQAQDLSHLISDLMHLRDCPQVQGLVNVMNDISILVLKTQELNPGSQKADPTLQTSPGPTNPLKDGLKSLTSYFETRQSPKDNSQNGHQIDANLEPPKTRTYAAVAACLKEVKPNPILNSANDLPACHLERIVQLNYSGDMVNSGSRMKHCHFYSPEQALPGPPTPKNLSQDPCPTSTLSANLNPAKIEGAKSHVIFHLNSSQVDHQAAALPQDQPAKLPQALYRPPGAPFGHVHFTEYPQPGLFRVRLGDYPHCRPLDQD